jgi:hypothetical protein
MDTPIMVFPTRLFVARVIIVCALLAMLLPAQAKPSAWKDAQGASFKGEPTAILGPFAVFRTSGGGGRRVLLRAFSAEDCLRIRAEIAAIPARSGSFGEATGAATSQLIGRVQRLQKGELVPADLAGQREPDLLLVLSGSHNSGDGWFMSSNLQLFYWRVQRVYPELMEGVFLGARHDAGQHRTIAINTGMPWLVTDFHRQVALSSLRHYVPNADGTNVVLVTRQGVPLLGSPMADIASLRSFVDQASEFIWQIDPANPAGWSDRLHYLNATRPVEYAQSRAEPLLVGNPLRPDVLRKYGIKRVAARLAVAPDGKVTPTILSGPEDVPEELNEAISIALSRAVVAPALEQGRAVAGSLDYTLEVPAADPRREGEQLWLSSTTYPVLPIAEWLVLRPIKVSEQDFESTIVGEKPDGTVILNAFEVNSGKISRKAQLSAFNTDWFTETGADSVRPKVGDRQLIDGETVLKWETVRSQDGFVDLQTGVPKDYTVGYAWTEFESPRETEAWLGLGSDDGVKLWLNGELVHDQWIRRLSRMDDEVVPLHLKKGANRMLIKIQNATGDWNFMYRLRLKP